MVGNSLAIQEEALKQDAHNGLNQEQLTEPGEGKIEARQLQPVGRQRQQVEAVHIWRIHPCSNKGRCRAYDAHGRGYNGGFKQCRMRGSRIKLIACRFERQRAAQRRFQRISQHKFDQEKKPLLFISKGALAGADNGNRTRNPHPYQGSWYVAHAGFLRFEDQNTCTQFEIHG